MMRLLRPSHISIFLRSFGSHSTHYAREMIAEICSMGDIALRSPCSAQARGGLPWPPARRMRRAPSPRRSLLGQAPDPFNVMRFILPRFRALIGIASCGALVLWGAPAAQAADPQTYKVEFAPTGNGAMDGTLRATSDLQSLRSSAPVSPYGLIARARGDVDRLKTVLESYGYYQSKVTMKIDGLALNDPGLAEELAALPKKRDARVQVSFALGPLYHLRGVAIDGELPPTAQGVLGLK